MRESIRKHACEIWNYSVKLELDKFSSREKIAEMRRLSVVLFQASSGDSAGELESLFTVATKSSKG